jgi:HD-like signal output (HDOD) protein
LNPALSTPLFGSLAPDDLVRELKQLPSSPNVLPRLAKMLKGDSASIGEVIELIRVDSAITARTLQIGSSAYYSPHGTPCENVEEAVGRVGFDEIYKLVSYAATAQLLMRQLDAYNLKPDDTWRLSVTCALAAEDLAHHAGVDPSLAYTVGLLHGIGLIAIDAWGQARPASLRFDSDGLPNEMADGETRVFGFTNAAVAAALLRLWEFPTSIIDPICCQYEPREAKDEPLMACLLHVAKWLRDASHLADDLPLPREPEAWIMDTMDLTSRDLELRLYTVRSAFLKVSNLLK